MESADAQDTYHRTSAFVENLVCLFVLCRGFRVYNDAYHVLYIEEAEAGA